MGRAGYYKEYYDLKKHIYRERYYDKKRIDKDTDELYAKWGGEKEYIKMYWSNSLWKVAPQDLEKTLEKIIGDKQAKEGETMEQTKKH